jgi:hypothetical protein
MKMLNIDPSGHLTFCCELSNFNGDRRPAESRSDFVADLATTPLDAAMALQQRAIERFRTARRAHEAAGSRTEDDRFACRYCIRHFGKPEHGVVQLRRPQRLTG